MCLSRAYPNGGSPCRNYQRNQCWKDVLTRMLRLSLRRSCIGEGGVRPRRVRNDVRFFAALRLRRELSREGDPTGIVMSFSMSTTQLIILALFPPLWSVEELCGPVRPSREMKETFFEHTSLLSLGTFRERD